MLPASWTGTGALLLFAFSVQAKHVHDHLQSIHRRHREERVVARQINETLVKRGTCAFPSDAGLVAVSPSSGNGGWAFAPDQSCTVGRYCPYACPPGQVSMQWDPSVTSYVYPGSRNGGLLCNSDGTLSKPFADKPYCQSTTANVGVQNNCGGKNVAFCQTVLPGDEDMLIPTDVSSWAKIAVPDTTYWAGTAAHYYINPPGVSSTQGCVWGSTANPWGNWAPYVAGANTDASGLTFIKLGWNPIYLETTTPFRNQMPKWGVRIECPNGGCNGLPCSIDPAKNKVNEMTGSASNGAGGGSFCVVTVNKGLKANFVVFDSTPSSTPSSSATPSKTSASGGSGWGNYNQGGQFYQTSSVLDSGDAINTADVDGARATGTASVNGSSSGTSTGPTDNATGKPYYQLFNSSIPVSASLSSKSSSTATSTLIAQHTGGASSFGVSVGAVMIGLGAMIW